MYEILLTFKFTIAFFLFRSTDLNIAGMLVQKLKTTWLKGSILPSPVSHSNLWGVDPVYQKYSDKGDQDKASETQGTSHLKHYKYHIHGRAFLSFLFGNIV